MTKKLPILLSIPHGGTNKPKELKGRLCITRREQFDDSDPFVSEIYDLKNSVQYVMSTDIARVYVDLNRSPKDTPPRNSDGVIKSLTCYRKPIYLAGMEPDESLVAMLLDMYHAPYYDAISHICKKSEIQMGFDCHSMASVAPDIAPDAVQTKKKKRPLFCISNQNGKTCSNKQLKLLASHISESFGVSLSSVALNDPFKGGYLTSFFGNNPVPWIQIEMNRDMYLNKQWFDVHTLKINYTRLVKLNQMFKKAMTNFCIDNKWI